MTELKQTIGSTLVPTKRGHPGRRGQSRLSPVNIGGVVLMAQKLPKSRFAVSLLGIIKAEPEGVLGMCIAAGGS